MAPTEQQWMMGQGWVPGDGAGLSQAHHDGRRKEFLRGHTDWFAISEALRQNGLPSLSFVTQPTQTRTLSLPSERWEEEGVLLRAKAAYHTGPCAGWL